MAQSGKTGSANPPPLGADDTERVASRIGDVARELLDRPLEPGLYLVSTPIGNLGDITLRAISVLVRADLVLCEDTRRSRVLLAHFAAGRELQTYHEHNAARERPRILARLQEGKSVALISDAGTPLISDPGFKLVREAVELDISVFCVPGPSAAMAALTIGGLPTDSFFFAGFLSAKGEARRRRLETLASIPATLVLYETAVRVNETVRDIANVLGDREVVVARELTKRHEEVLRGKASEMGERLAQRPVKGEIVLLVSPPAAQMVSDDDIRAALKVALARGSVKDSVKEVAESLKVHRKRVYSLALESQNGADDRN